MKSLFTLFIIAFIASGQVFSQVPKPSSPRITTEGSFIKVAYGQPSKRGRVIFGELVPYGKVWRTGANEATEITFNKNVKIAGKFVKAGTYTLFTIPNPKSWTFILNAQLGQFGVFEYENHKSKNVLETTIPSRETSTSMEKFTIKIKDKTDGADLILQWENISVSVPISYL